MGTGRRLFTTLSPEQAKMFKLDFYFDNQIMTYLWEIYDIWIYVLWHNAISKQKCNIVKSQKITLCVIL